MAESNAKVSSPASRLMFRRQDLFVLLLLLSALFILIASGLGVKYVTQRTLKGALINTTCLLLNYTALKHSCTIPGFGGVTGGSYPCFSGRFQFLYSINNQTRIKSVLTLDNHPLTYYPTKVRAYSLSIRHHIRSISLFCHLDWPQLHVLL